MATGSRLSSTRSCGKRGTASSALPIRARVLGQVPTPAPVDDRRDPAARRRCATRRAGTLRKAPPEVGRARASVERKARERKQIAAWVSELAQNASDRTLRARLKRCCSGCRTRTRSRWKALNAACEARRISSRSVLAALLRRDFDALSLRRVRRGKPSRKSGYRPWGRCPRSPTCFRRGRRLSDRRREHHRARRRVLRSASRERSHYERSASTSRCPALAIRDDRRASTRIAMRALVDPAQRCVRSQARDALPDEERSRRATAQRPALRRAR